MIRSTNSISPSPATASSNSDRDLLDHRDERQQALADELVGDDVANPSVAVAVAVLQDVRSEDVARAELVVAVGSVHRPVETGVVLEAGVDVVVPADHPAVVEAVVIDGMVITQAAVQREGIPLEFLGIELAWVDGGVDGGRHGSPLVGVRTSRWHAGCRPSL